MKRLWLLVLVLVFFWMNADLMLGEDPQVTQWHYKP